MADYTQSKSGPGKVYPDDAQESAWSRVEPLLTPAQLRTRFLFGIPLVSAVRDPISKWAQVMTDDLLKDYIDRAVALVEDGSSATIAPLKLHEKHPFDLAAYNAYGHLKVEQRPCASIERMTVTMANTQDIYEVPIEWIETAYLPQGQINIIPLVSAVGYSSPAAVLSGGAIFLSFLGNYRWIPSFWQVDYTAGFPDSQLPKPLNELIGTVAAMEVLSALAATYARSTSQSIGMDSMSQSTSGPGPQLYLTRLQDLEKKKERLMKKFRSQYALTLYSFDV